MAATSITGDRPVLAERGPRASVPTALVATLDRLLAWKSLVAIVLLVILFVPARRYTLPSSLPFHAEPYRVVIGFVLLAWVASLLVDPRVRLRRTHIDRPFLAFILIAIASLVVNHQRASSVAPVLIKQLAFFASVFIFVYLIASVLPTVELVATIVKVLVASGAVLAVAAIIEARTGSNLFAHLNRFIPFLDVSNVPTVNVATDSRGARIRAFASSQHPIELGAVLVMLMPLAFSLAYATRQRRWWIALALLLPAMMGALSRTSVPMVFAIVLVAFWLRRSEVVKLWPALLPMLLVIHFLVPGTLGGLVKSFFPEGGLIAQQSDTTVGSGRIATLGPTLHNELAPNPLLGVGFETRVTTDDDPQVPANAPILDNQWLGTLVETGILGAVCLLWLFIRFVRRCGSAAKTDRTIRGWLLTGITASIAAAMVGMLTYDTFSFTQATFLIFTLLGLGAALVSARNPSASAAATPVHRPM